MKLLILMCVIALGALLYLAAEPKHETTEQKCPDSPILGDKYDCDFKILGGDK